MDFVIIGQASEGAQAGAGAFSQLAPPLQIALFLGALSFLTALMVCVTAFTRIVIVLSFVRRALATQEIPPNPVLLGLSLFLTMFVMAPTMEAINKQGIQPYLQAQRTARPNAPPDFTLEDLWEVTSSELRLFMSGNTRTADLQLFTELADLDQEVPRNYERDEVPLTVLVPAFVISELKTAFIMGFCLYIPFLLIDLVVSTILMSLGMMMMPPVVVSTPCKLLLFVLVDGWQLVTRALVSSFTAI
jgi:flagellar biosynthetic protein FliP